MSRKERFMPTTKSAAREYIARLEKGLALEPKGTKHYDELVERIDRLHRLIEFLSEDKA